MIDLHGQISVAFLKKSRFTGSFRGMRYLLQKKEQVTEKAGEDEAAKTRTVLEAVIWPEPMNFEMTDQEKKHGKIFSLDETGLWEAVDWLNEEYKAGNF